MLEVTTPAPAGMRERAGRTDSFDTGFKNFDCFAAREGRGGLRNFNADQLSRKAVAHEDHATVVEAPDAAARGRSFYSHEARKLRK
jgi:hypothetical protein